MKKYTLRLLTLALLMVLTLCLLPNSASAADQQLGAPTELTWNQRVDFGKYPREPEQSYGSVLWKPTAPISPAEPIQFEIKVYKDDALWNTVTWGFSPQLVSESEYLSCDLYAQKEFESGTYYFTVRAIDATGTYDPSDIVKSGTWTYTKPSARLTAPTNLRWDTADTIDGWWPWAKWDPVSGDDHTYEVMMYYSNEKNGTLSWFHQQWNITETKNAPPSFAIQDGLFGPGYYYFHVRTNSGNIAEVSNSLWAESEPYHWKLAAPEVEITNVASSGKPKITWDEVEFAEKYHVYRATSKTGEFKHLKTTTSTSFTDTSATAGKVYYYKVRAITGTGYKTAFSTPVYLRCDLKRPTVEVANVASSGLPRLSWSAVSGAEKYLVYRRSADESSYTRIASTTSVTYTDKTAEVGTKYYYKVMAVHENTAANSAKSAAVSSTCDLARPVVNIKLSSGNPRLTWDKIDGAEKYYVYRATSKSGDYIRIKTTKTATSFTDTDVTSGKTYYYRVKAIHSNTAANSAYSATDSITAK